MTTIKIEIKNLSAIKTAFSQAPALMTKNLSTAIKKTVFLIEGRAVAKANVRTGRLRASAYTDFGPLKGEIGFKATYAAAVHDGYGPHIIEAKNNGYLFWRGAAHPVKRVHHPGYKGNPFLLNAVNQSQGDVDRFFFQAVDDTLAEISKGAS